MLAAVLTIILVFWLVVRPYYWWRKGVPSVLPLPLFGNCLTALYKGNIPFWRQFYVPFKVPYLGIFFFTRPALFLKDPQIIMEVLEKKGPYFSSHGMYINADRDPMGKSVFHLSGQEWKDTRSKLTTFFTPNKLKSMSEIAERSTKRLMDLIDDRLDADINFHSAAMKLSIDVTAAALFGIESNIFQDGETSEFYIASKDLNTSMLKVFLNFVSPKLFEILQLNSFSTRTNNFVTRIVHDAIENCKQSPAIQNFMQGMTQLIETDKNCDFKFAVSQGSVMWVGGVETTANTLSFCLFELAANQQLQEEIRSSPSTEQRQLIRDVIAETLRKYPPFTLLMRSCTSDCTLDSGLHVEKGTLMLVHVYSLHHDPEIYPDPEDFRPGRTYPKGAYLPFGAGPRTCLGMRMAEMVLELALSKLLENYRFLPSHKSKSPVTLSPNSFFIEAEGGLWIKVNRIK